MISNFTTNIVRTYALFMHERVLEVQSGLIKKQKECASESNSTPSPPQLPKPSFWKQIEQTQKAPGIQGSGVERLQGR